VVGNMLLAEWIIYSGSKKYLKSFSTWVHLIIYKQPEPAGC
jgi:short-subunit dehydrogenase